MTGNTAAIPSRLSRLNAALIVLAVLLYGSLFGWLAATAAWPANCTPQPRQLFVLLWCSHTLLAGSWRELLLFAIIWALPIGLAAFVLRHRLRRGFR
jgi:hypothetical protein